MAEGGKHSRRSGGDGANTPALYRVIADLAQWEQYTHGRDARARRVGVLRTKADGVVVARLAWARSTIKQAGQRAAVGRPKITPQVRRSGPGAYNTCHPIVDHYPASSHNHLASHACTRPAGPRFEWPVHRPSQPTAVRPRSLHASCHRDRSRRPRRASSLAARPRTVSTAIAPNPASNTPLTAVSTRTSHARLHKLHRAASRQTPPSHSPRMLTIVFTVFS
ncbi:hypothetical protein B0J12DRAFT_693008 [Macrophomina phaseolina]|uniref:Uncharacterized protein n=1 Tax=Macrophomina phaseolina TaxID=35725 RepID=A0ABQ8GTH9_9PEZI|nr:hypothetical protein B0J12DRAFT_693008 [Macrophomina phaseolina]